jgi:hypothetical protein
MCFSAQASFGASAVLGTIGFFSYRKATTPAQKIFAGLPALFAFQQLMEGLLWVAIQNEYTALRTVSTYVFIIIAQIIWPFLVPFSIALLEPDLKRKKWLNLLLLFGGVASVYLAYCIAIYEVRSEIDCYHIHYVLTFPHTNFPVIALFYILPTIFSPFLSSLKRMKQLGLLILTTFIISELFYKKYALSVWCFFAALMSIEVYMVIKQANKPRTVL